MGRELRCGCMNPGGIGKMKFINGTTSAQLNMEVIENFMMPSLKKPSSRAFSRRMVAPNLLLIRPYQIWSKLSDLKQTFLKVVSGVQFQVN